MRQTLVGFVARAGIVIFAIAACGQGESQRPAPRVKQEPAPAQTGPPTLTDLFDPRIVTTSDGGAYATGLAGGIWYLKGAEAKRVAERP